MIKPLEGKTALVTGGAKRIGRAIAIRLAEAGANVVITFRESSLEARSAVADLQAVGGKAFAIRCDLAQQSSIHEAMRLLIKEFGRLDILVNSAGSFASVPLPEITVEQWDAMFASNTRGPFLMAQAAHPYLKENATGRIVNVGSLGGLEPWPTHAHYCASKAALHMLSKTMARAWAPEISVNCIAPGMIVLDEPAAPYQKFADRTPMKRNGTAEDVVAAVLFFATGPHFITGQVLAVDGGLGL